MKSSYVAKAEKDRQRVLTQMDTHEVTVSDLARQAEVDRSGLSRFLNHGGSPTMEWLDRVLLGIRRATRKR